MNFILGIYDSDIEYSNQLMSYIKRKHKRITQVRVFTNKTILLEYLDNNQITILLLSEDKMDEDMNHNNIKHRCILSEEGIDEVSTQIPIINKYQSVEQIVERLFTYYPELSIKSVSSPLNNSKIITVFSLKNDYGKDNFSLNLANQYGLIKKTLFINFNLLHGGNHSFSQQSNKNLSEFLYFLKQQHPNLLLKMKEQIIKKGNFDYLQGVKFGPDLFELTLQELDNWIKELNSSEYEVIIFNVGCFYNTILELFRKSNRLLFITGEDIWDISIFDNYKEQLLWAGFEDVLEKIQIITLQKELIKSLYTYDMDQVFSDEWGEFVQRYVNVEG